MSKKKAADLFHYQTLMARAHTALWLGLPLIFGGLKLAGEQRLVDSESEAIEGLLIVLVVFTMLVALVLPVAIAVARVQLQTRLWEKLGPTVSAPDVFRLVVQFYPIWRSMANQHLFNAFQEALQRKKAKPLPPFWRSALLAADALILILGVFLVLLVAFQGAYLRYGLAWLGWGVVTFHPWVHWAFSRQLLLRLGLL